jgi:hypothetical protein
MTLVATITIPMTARATMTAIAISPKPHARPTICDNMNMVFHFRFYKGFHAPTARPWLVSITRTGDA